MLHDLLDAATHAQRDDLPANLSGLCKTDLLIGKCDQDVWVGATVTSNPSDLESAPGLGIGIIPCGQGEREDPRFDSKLGMWVAPVPYDNAFTEMFSCCWRLVEAFLTAYAKAPSEEYMPEPAYREVAKLLAGLRDKPVIDVIALVTEMSDRDFVEVDRVPTIAPGFPGNHEAESSVLFAPVPLSAQSE